MVTPVGRPLDAPVSASYERAAFGRVNVRSSAPLGAAAHARFRYLVRLFDERLAEGRRREVVRSDDPRTPWFVTLFDVRDMGDGDFVGLADRFLLLTFRRESDGDEGTVLALDKTSRWFAICPPESTSLHDARIRAQALMRSIVGQWGQSRQRANEYDLDYVTSADQLRAWLLLHPSVTDVTIWIAHTNPGTIYSEADMERQREVMRGLGADLTEITYRTTRGGSLDDLHTVIDAIEPSLLSGSAQTRIRAVRDDGDVEETNTRNGLEQARLQPYNASLLLLVVRVLQTLVRWVAVHG